MTKNTMSTSRVTLTVDFTKQWLLNHLTPCAASLLCTHHSEGASERLLSDDESEHDADSSFHQIGMVARRNLRGGIHGLWERIDEKYLKPVFGGQPRDERAVKVMEMKGKTSKRSGTRSPSSMPRSPNSRREQGELSPASSTATSPMSMAEVASSHEASDNV